jgi:tight adherence protein B
LNIPSSVLSIFCFIAVVYFTIWLIDKGLDWGPFRAAPFYQKWWNAKLEVSRPAAWVYKVPRLQIAGFTAALIAWSLCHHPALLVSAIAIALLPLALLIRHEKSHIEKLQQRVDSFLLALADSLAAVPNLSEALATLQPDLESPFKEEVAMVLGELRLGRDIDEALNHLAARLKNPGLDAGVRAVLLGKRLGGDLPRTLRTIAASIREMNRLEGVVRSMTAEGRSQAWVMGAIPIAMLVMIDHLNPEWLEPMWEDPIGWGLLALSGLLECIAILLFRKIVDVEI